MKIMIANYKTKQKSKTILGVIRNLVLDFILYCCYCIYYMRKYHIHVRHRVKHQIHYASQFLIISQCGPLYCTLPKKAFLSPLVWARREYIWKLNWKESNLLIYFENWQGTPCSHRQSRNRMMNTFIIVNITPIFR